MNILQRYWGNIPVSPRSKGLKIFFAFISRILHCIARYFPLIPGLRVLLHRLRGVKIGCNVFIGTEVFIDDAEPGSVTIEDDVTILAQSTIIGHSYYPFHFSGILEDAMKRRGVLIKKGAYLGLGSVVLPGVTIGEYSIIGACSLVVENIPAYSMAVGSPAKVIRKFNKDSLNVR